MKQPAGQECSSQTVSTPERSCDRHSTNEIAENTTDAAKPVVTMTSG